MRFRLKSGRVIAYHTYGAGDLIVLLHPIGMNAQFWRPVVDHLSRDHRLISIDLHGHGESDVSAGPMSLESMADDCIELIEGVGGPCVVGGCSMGSAVAQAIAARNPAFLKGAIFANGSGPRVPGAGRSDAIEIRAGRAERGMAEIMPENIDRWFSPEFREAHPDAVDGVREILLADDPMVHARCWRALAARSDQYERILCPVLVVGATKDVSATPDGVRALAAVLADARLAMIEGAGHFAPMERPEEFANLIRAFVSERKLFAPLQDQPR